jgi:hypothetical protein
LARFTRWYAVYPRKEAKAAAQKAFLALDPDDPLVALLIAAVERAAQSPQWRKEGGAYIPMPATWLNQRRWEDEPCEVATPVVSDLTAHNQRVVDEFVRLLDESETDHDR